MPTEAESRPIGLPSGEMHWNHRVIRTVDSDGEERFSIREVHYEGGRLLGYVEDPEGVAAESLDGLRKYVAWMAAALDEPTLTPTDFGIMDAAQTVPDSHAGAGAGRAVQEGGSDES